MISHLLDRYSALWHLMLSLSMALIRAVIMTESFPSNTLMTCGQVLLSHTFPIRKFPNLLGLHWFHSSTQLEGGGGSQLGFSKVVFKISLTNYWSLPENIPVVHLLRISLLENIHIVHHLGTSLPRSTPTMHPLGASLLGNISVVYFLETSLLWNISVVQPLGTSLSCIFWEHLGLGTFPLYIL